MVVRDAGTFRPPVPTSSDGAPSGFGMTTMRERTEPLGGTLDVATDSGTTVGASVPLAGDAEDPPAPATRRAPKA